MKQVNRIELCGTVGCIRAQNVGDGLLVDFSLATNYSYRDSNGCPVIETTWHNVRAWNDCCDQETLERLQKGSTVHVEGRLRCDKYAASDGSERVLNSVIAHKLQIVRP